MEVKIQRAYKTELDPTNKQRTMFAKHAGTARFAYNWGLRQRIAEYEATGKSSNYYVQNPQLNALKKEEYPWMYEVSSDVPQEALRDLDKAFKHFFRRCKNGEKPGFPKIKTKKKGLGGFRLYNPRIESSRIKLPRIGWVKLKEFDFIPTNCKTNGVTVTEKAGRWFISVQVEEMVTIRENQGKVIGLDLGLSSLVVGSDGSNIAPPKPLRRSLKRLKRQQRAHSRKQKGSSNRKKSARKLARMHYRVGCKRKDFLHKLTTDLVRNHSIIVVENLNTAGMMQNHKLAQGIADASWGELVRQLRYKSEWHGAKVVEADRFFPSTKKCSWCGSVKDGMSLSERTYHCQSCGISLDRDFNAARNLKQIATGDSPGRNACGDGRSTKQEPSTKATFGL